MPKSINPTTGQTILEYPEQSTLEVEEAVHRAQGEYGLWQAMALQERARKFVALAYGFRARASSLAELMAQEMGKPVAAGEAEIEKCAAACEYFASHGAGMLEEIQVPSDTARTLVRFDPLGVVLAIMPWNFPFWQLIRFAAPALMAGNVSLLKHAPNVSGCALAIEELFKEAGFGDGVMQTLLLSNERTEELIGHPGIAAVTLTGSVRAGRAVARAAAQSLKKSVLELGGSDAFIVLEDVDIQAVAKAAALARCINGGQSCIAAKRFIVERKIAVEFEQRFAEAMSHLIVGDPMDRTSQIGPLAHRDLLDNLESQVARTVAAGGRLLTGGRRLPRAGFFYPPTVISDVEPGMAGFDEETFGPVAFVVKCDGPEEAVKLANTSAFGLGASVWTKDVAKAAWMAKAIEAGNVFFNDPVKSDARLPFGGIKQSGWGRELGLFGMREFVNIKTVSFGR